MLFPGGFDQASDFFSLVAFYISNGTILFNNGYLNTIARDMGFNNTSKVLSACKNFTDSALLPTGGEEISDMRISLDRSSRKQ